MSANTHSFPRARFALRDLEVLEAQAWADAIRGAVATGERVLTAYGRREGESVLLTGVLQRADGTLRVLRGRAERARGYHALTETLAAMHCFEREMHEQTGIALPGHPWLKPVRFEGQGPHARREYPFYRVAGKEIHEVQVGPVHAGVIEPGGFRFQCLGETVHHLEIHHGFQHRGVEAMMLQGNPRAHTQLVETVAGDTSVAHAWAYCAVLETLAGIECDAGRERSRAFGLELERVGMHLAGLAGMATDVGFLQGGSTYGRLRTTAINTTMRLCGSRFGRAWVRPGIDRVAADDALAKTVRGNLGLMKRDVALINDAFTTAATVQHRLRGIGALTAEQATDLGLVGMAARMAGVSLDQRGFARGAYGDDSLKPVVENDGDCWARAMVRIREIDASLAWLEGALERGLSGDPRARSTVGALAPDELVVATVEGWRGEVVHCAETDAQGNFAHYKLQDPSLRNWFGLAMALRENEISDFPICNKSFDLSYCGNDL